MEAPYAIPTPQNELFGAIAISPAQRVPCLQTPQLHFRSTKLKPLHLYIRVTIAADHPTCQISPKYPIKRLNKGEKVKHVTFSL